MKKIVLIVIGVFSIISCEPGTCFNSSQTIVNNSGKDIKITSYFYVEPPTFSKEINLKSGEHVQSKQRSCPPLDPRISFRGMVQGDSIVIDYGDKIKSYTKISVLDERNPYQLDFQNKSNDFVYILTPEDYANATPKP